jgi:hypothetical protein
MPVKGTPSYYTHSSTENRAVVLYTNNSTYDLMDDSTIKNYSKTDQFTTFCANIVKSGGWKADKNPAWKVPAEPPKPPKK